MIINAKFKQSWSINLICEIINIKYLPKNPRPQKIIKIDDDDDDDDDDDSDDDDDDDEDLDGECYLMKICSTKRKRVSDQIQKGDDDDDLAKCISVLRKKKEYHFL
ncbi:hypothetical protein Tco_0457643 [Tanacetum coccineum]